MSDNRILSLPREVVINYLLPQLRRKDITSFYLAYPEYMEYISNSLFTEAQKTKFFIPFEYTSYKWTEGESRLAECIKKDMVLTLTDYYESILNADERHKFMLLLVLYGTVEGVAYFYHNGESHSGVTGRMEKVLAELAVIVYDLTEEMKDSVDYLLEQTLMSAEPFNLGSVLDTVRYSTRWSGKKASKAVLEHYLQYVQTYYQRDIEDLVRSRGWGKFR